MEKNRWKNISREQYGQVQLDASQYAAEGKYYARIGERHERGCCADESTGVLVFDSATDFINYLGDCFLPRIIAERTGVEIGKVMGSVEDYLKEAEEDLRAQVSRLKANIDNCVAKGNYTPVEIKAITADFTEIFSNDNPQFWISGTGNLKEIIENMIKVDNWGSNRDEIDEEILEDEAVKLVQAGKFEEKRAAHLKLAKEFLRGW